MAGAIPVCLVESFLLQDSDEAISEAVVQVVNGEKRQSTRLHVVSEGQDEDPSQEEGPSLIVNLHVQNLTASRHVRSRTVSLLVRSLIVSPHAQSRTAQSLQSPLHMRQSLIRVVGPSALGSRE